MPVLLGSELLVEDNITELGCLIAVGMIDSSNSRGHLVAHILGIGLPFLLASLWPGPPSKDYRVFNPLIRESTVLNITLHQGIHFTAKDIRHDI